jgi:hypothetical protein
LYEFGNGPTTSNSNLAGRQETVKRLDPKDGQLNKWAKQIWLQAMTEAKVSIQTLITTKLTLCLDAAWEKILAQTEAQGTELTGEFYTNVLGKCEDRIDGKNSSWTRE